MQYLGLKEMTHFNLTNNTFFWQMILGGLSEVITRENLYILNYIILYNSLYIKTYLADFQI